MEWPEIIESILPKKRLTISFDFGQNHDRRKVIFSGDETWQKRLQGIV
jgi:tRNA A37 threonylcarbamoyladenosine biosynthesis protein TsaE